MDNNKTKLHLGCGDNYLEGYINIDLPLENQTIIEGKADMRSNIFDLDFKKESIDEIRLHQVFEHFSRQESLSLILMWRQWLKPGGVLIIETPDFEECVKKFLETDDLRTRFVLGRHIFGSHEAKWAFHKDYWCEDKFNFILSRLGFKDIRCVKYKNNLAKKFSPKILFEVLGEQLPEYFSKFGLNNLPNIICYAVKSDGLIDERKSIEEILSLSLVGKEEEMLDVWMKEIKFIDEQ